jgi:hypothetical protein
MCVRQTNNDYYRRHISFGYNPEKKNINIMSCQADARFDEITSSTITVMTGELGLYGRMSLLFNCHFQTGIEFHGKKMHPLLLI